MKTICLSLCAWLLSLPMFGAASTTTSFFKSISASGTVSANSEVVSNGLSILGGVLSVAELDVDLIITTNVIPLLDTPVASLVAPPAATFPTRYSSDAITSSGVGSYVRWNGTAWKTTENITPVTDVPSFMIQARLAGLPHVVTPISYIQFTSENFDVNNYPGRTLAFVGTGGAASGVLADSRGPFLQYKMGTVTNAQAKCVGWLMAAALTNEFIGQSGKYYVSALCSAAEQYWAWVGFHSLTDYSFPTNGVGFLYDMMGLNCIATGANWTNSAASNNWQCVTCKDGVYTVSDSGLAVSASVANSLYAIQSSGDCYFYTNGVIASHQTTIASIPTTLMYGNRVIAQKWLGTTARSLYEFSPSIHVRHAARTY